LGVDDLLLLLNHHWARDTSTFPTERHRVQFALILLLLFGTGCRPAELVDAKRKRREATSSDDDDDFEVDDNADLGPEDSDDSCNNNDNHNDTFEDVDTMIRHFDALCYEDVRLLLVRSPDSGERDVLAMEVVMAHKGHNRRPKP
jgi:hypothetical protein